MVMEDAAEVSIERTSTILPATPTDRQSMFLSSCDLVCRSYPYINRVFFYDFKDDYPSVVDALKSSLEEALVLFYPLAGRFAEDEEGRLEVDCNDAGVDFVEAVANVPFSDLQCDGFQYRKLFWKLARRTELLRSDFLHQPILTVQVTKFQGGGLSIGLSLSHAVADAQSFYDFVRSWAETCKRVPLSVTPLHIRTALKVESLYPVEHCADEPAPYTKKKTNGYHMEEDMDTCLCLGEKFLSAMVVEKKKAPPIVEKQQPQQVAAIVEKQHAEEELRQPRTDLVQKVFSFSREALQRLKKKTAQEGASEPFTTFESFCAHWWRALIRARDLPDEHPVFLLIPINCRQRFLSLPKGYFGNSLDGALVKSTAGELVTSDLASIAAKIHKSIISVTEDSFRKYIKEAEARRNSIPHFDRRGLFHVVDSPRYPIYETDFGWGAPSAVRAEGFRFGAEVQVIAGRTGEGSMDLFFALDEQSMKRLEEDEDFLVAC